MLGQRPDGGKKDLLKGNVMPCFPICSSVSGPHSWFRTMKGGEQILSSGEERKGGCERELAGGVWRHEAGGAVVKACSPQQWSWNGQGSYQTNPLLTVLAS